MAVAGEVELEVRARLGRAEADIRRMQGRLREFDRQGTRNLRNVDRAASRLSGTVARLAAAFISFQAVRQAVSVLANFSQEMSTVRAITGATEQQFAQLSEEAQRLGATTRFSASQAAQGMTFLARAGFSAQESLQATEGTLRLAQAGALDLGSAADIASNILTGFRLEVSETARVVDVLAFAANNSNTNVMQLGNAMKFVAPVAAGLGVDIEEAAAAIGALSDAGLQGSLAGTGLRRVLAELESPANKTREILASVGLTVDDVRVSSVGLTEALRRMREAGIDTGQALEIFGDRGGPAFEVLSSSIPRVQEMTAELDNAAGTADRIATVMDENLNGALLAVRSAAEAVIISFGEIQGTTLESVLRGLANVLRFTANNMETIVNFATSLGVAFAATKVAALASIPAVRAYAASVATIGPAAATATAAVSALRGAIVALGGPLGIALLAAGSATVALGVMSRNNRRAAESAREAAEAQREYNDTLELIDEILSEGTLTGEKLIPDAQSFAEGQAAIERYRRDLQGISEDALAAKVDAIEATREQIRQIEAQAEAGREQIVELDRRAEELRRNIERAPAEGLFTRIAGNELELVLEDIGKLNVETVDAERSLRILRERLQELYETPPDEFLNPEGAERITTATQETLSALRQRLVLTREDDELQRRINAALIDAGLALDSQSEAAREIRNINREIFAIEQARARQNVVEGLEERLAITRQEGELQQEIARALFAAGLSLDDQSQTAQRIREIVAEIHRIERAREQTIDDTTQKIKAQTQADAERARQARETAQRQLESIEGTDLSGKPESELDRLQTERDRRLEIIQNAIESEILTEQEGRQRLLEIDRQFTEARRELLVSAMGDAFGQMADLTRQFAGEQSAAYKVMFGIEQAFRLSEAIMAAKSTILKAAASAAPPANIPAIALAVAQTAPPIAAIAAQTFTGFAEGGLVQGSGTGTSDSIPAALSQGEFVVNAAATRRHQGVLRAMNEGVDLGGAKVEIDIKQMPGVAVEMERMDDGRVELIARQVVAREAPGVVSASMDDPNSRVSKSLQRNVRAARRRN